MALSYNTLGYNGNAGRQRYIDGGSKHTGTYAQRATLNEMKNVTCCIHGLIVSNTNHYGQEAIDMQWKCIRYNPKEANVELEWNACNSLTNHDTDVVEDLLWQVHENMLVIP